MKNVYRGVPPLHNANIREEPYLLWPSVLFILFVLVPILSVGLETVLFCVFLFFPAMLWVFSKAKMPAEIPRFAGLLLMMMLVGLVSFTGHQAYDVAKDMWYILNPALALTAGYVLMLNLKDMGRLLKAFIIAATLIAIFHLLKIVIHPETLHHNAMDIRSEGGAGFLAPVVSVALFLAAKKMNIRVFGKHGWLSYTAFILCLLSTILSFTRTFEVSLVIMVFVIFGWINFESKNKVIFIATFAALFIGIGMSIPYSNVSNSHEISDKILHSFQEIKIREYSDLIEINNNWRGFESSRALITYRRGTWPEYIVGQGLGTPIDLGFYMELGQGTNGLVRFAPWVHNGYMFLLVKTGIVGVLLYLFLIYRLVRHGTLTSMSSSPDMRYAGRLIVGLALVIVISTWVVGGMFNTSAFLPASLLTGALLAYSSVVKLKAGENQSNVQAKLHHK